MILWIVRVENCRNGAKPFWDEARELGEKEKSKEKESNFTVNRVN